MSPAAIRVPGRIVRREGTRAWVVAQPQDGCAACAAGRGCGGGVLGRLVASRRRPVAVDDVTLDSTANAEVWLLIDTGLLNRLAVWTWGVPVLILIAAAGLAEVVSGTAGMILGLAVSALALVSPRLAAKALTARSVRVEAMSDAPATAVPVCRDALV